MDLSPDAADVTSSDRRRALIAVAAGGSLGAVARWLAGEWIGGRDAADGVARFPWDTLFVNVVGCLLIGVAATGIPRNGLRWSFVVTGVLGGFTTMSAFAVELNDLADAGRTGLLVTYLAATLAGSALAFAAGERTLRPTSRRARSDDGDVWA